jgi:hypothetical protein
MSVPELTCKELVEVVTDYGGTRRATRSLSRLAAPLMEALKFLRPGRVAPLQA